MTAALHAGFGRADITAYEPGMALFGYGAPGNVARGVAMPLAARAAYVREGAAGPAVAYVCLDLGFVSESLRAAVVDRVAARVPGLDASNVMVTATHTHAGPGGFSTYLFYAATAPGFSARVHDALAGGAARAVAEAAGRAAPARLWRHEGRVPIADPVAFNRALAAYNANPDVEPLPEGRRDEAVDRAMTVLAAYDLDGRPLGLVSWLGSHGTCVKGDNTWLHPDHKGVAAARCEATARDELGARDFVAVFAQGAAGDVSPCFRWAPARGCMLGAHDDDFRSAEEAGAAQARRAWRLFREAPREGSALAGPVRGAVRVDDFACAPVDADLAGGRGDVTTAPGRLGVGFAEGTGDGPGPLHRLAGLRKALTARRAAALGAMPHGERMQGVKVAWYDVGLGARGRALGHLPAAPSALRYVPDARARYFHEAVASGREADRPWVPHALPLQVLRVGSLAVVGVALEPTTVAGRRLRAAALAALARAGVEAAVVNGYANAYASYLTTPEEYDLQHYEAACTLFGRWTLPAVQTSLRRLCEAFPGA